MAKIAAPHVRVNCISPGFFNTNLVEGDTPQELIDQVPMLREAQPEEIIPVIDMLQKSTYMTGANIVIDGGLSLWLTPARLWPEDAHVTVPTVTPVK